MYNILLSTCVFIDALVWFASTRSIYCKSKNDSGFSLTHRGRFAPSLFVHNNANEPKCITDLLDLCGVVSDQHTSLLEVVELLRELQLIGCGAGGEDSFQVPLNILRRFCIIYVAEHLFTHAGREAVQDLACYLLLGWKVFVPWLTCYIIFSFCITLVSVDEKILVHLVCPRCIVALVELLYWKGATHTSIHVPVVPKKICRLCVDSLFR